MFRQLGERNSHCWYRSMGLRVTGEPVMMRLYRAPRPTFSVFLLRAEPGVLMVVLSSTAIMALCTSKKRLANAVPRCVLKASTFMIRIFRSSVTSKSLSMDCCSALRGEAAQIAMRYTTWLGMCLGISVSYQLRYTPLGAMIKSPLILPLSYSRAALLMSM